jgi:hypothetical protein
MSCRLVCISRDFGAQGDTVGRLVADRLGLRYVDEEVIARAAERGGIESGVVADAEQRKSRLLRVLDLLTDVGAGSGMMGVEPAPVRQAREAEHRQLILDVLEEIGGEGNAVIVAHAASMALAGRDGMLRVLVTASPEVRRKRLAESEGEEQAAKLVKQSDAARAEYFKRFYSIEQELPSHYDLVVSTDSIPPEQAAEIIVHAAGL